MVSRNLRACALAGLAAVGMSARADQIDAQAVGFHITGMSSNGGVAVGAGPIDPRWAFIWSAATGKVRLGRDSYPLVGFEPSPSVSGDGKTVTNVIASDAGTYATGGVWTQATGWRELGPLPAGGVRDLNIDSWPTAISRDGKVIAGFFQSGAERHAFTWTDATGIVDIGRSGAQSAITAANADGTVLAGSEISASGSDFYPAVWVNGVSTILEGGMGSAMAVNNDGTIIVGGSSLRDQSGVRRSVPAMWKWDGSTWVRTLLGPADAWADIQSAIALSLSDDGRMIVGYGSVRVGRHQKSRGFVWTPSTGMILADDYFEALGHPMSGQEDYVLSLVRITPNGQTIAAEVGAYDPATTECTGGCLMRRVPTATASAQR